MLETNKNKICFWHRRHPGSYRMGDINVEQIWHSDGVCADNFMWHVIVSGKTLITWAYLKEAKREAHLIDRYIKANLSINWTHDNLSRLISRSWE